mmetsp:Transcript_9245/g.10553  ORF Transcript_9245/g.10553 Transcript_9245/m.10553 type:complete len:571 (+) Transcript_9245:122-1834(+)
MIRFVPYLLALTSISAQTTYINPVKEDKSGYIAVPGKENECKIISSPLEGQLLFCTSSNGQITALDHVTLETLWKFPENSQDISCETGVAFSPETNTIIYGITKDDECGVHALSASREKKEEWEIFLDGKCSGTPVISSSGEYVFVTHNTGRTGMFTILKVDVDGQVDTLFDYEDDEEPFSPPGIYHNPDFGNYGNSTIGGLSNSNDIIIWANRPYEKEEGVGAAASYAFQFPVVFDGTTIGLSVTVLQRMNDPWKTIVPPTLTSGGMRLYWGVTKSKLLGWSQEDDRDRFTRKAPKSKGFDRGNPPNTPISAKVATTKSLEEPIIFTATATNQFHALSYKLDTLWNVTLAKGVVSEAQVSPDDKVVYFVDEVGSGYAYTVEGAKLWGELEIANEGVIAGYTQSVDGSHLYFASNSGIVSSFKVAEVSTADTPVPSSALPMTLAPTTIAPTAMPVSDTDSPVLPNPDTISPVSRDTDAPAPVAVVPDTSAPIVIDTFTSAPIMAFIPNTNPPTYTNVPTGDENNMTSAAPVTAVPVTAAPVTMAPIESKAATIPTTGLTLFMLMIISLVM